MDKKELLKKIEKLVARGIGGESVNAEALLKKIKEKYNITDADLAENETCKCWLKYRDKYEEKLAHQIGLMVLGEGFSAWRRGRKKEVGYRCTASECVEIYALYSFYRACWLKDLDHFYIAFINVNNLFPPTAGYSDETDYVALKMSKGLTKHEYLKQIEHKG